MSTRHSSSRRRVHPAVLVGLAMALVLAAGLAYVLSRPTVTPTIPTGGDNRALSSPTPGVPGAPSVSPTATAKGGTSGSSNDSGVFGSNFPLTIPSNDGGGGLSFAPSLRHKVTLQIITTEKVAHIGWLVPTSNVDAYGSAADASVPWTKTFNAGGNGYLAAIFVQLGPGGAPATCRITIDGKVADQKSVSGGYGQQVCLG